MTRPRVHTLMSPGTRPILWIDAARKAFDSFPAAARLDSATALTIAADGGMARIAKPLRGMGSGVFEIALPHAGNAYRVVYVVRIADEVWFIHAFQKNSTHGIKTSTQEIDLIKNRLKRLKEMVR